MVLGQGDFAGYYVTYDLQGNHIPVPDHYVPSTLREWDAIPSALEVIISEDLFENVETSTTAGSGLLSVQRFELKILPETGCGIDNLEVLERRERVSILTTMISTNDDLFTILKPHDSDSVNVIDHDKSHADTITTTTSATTTNNSNREMRLETIFGVVDTTNDKDGRYRCRLRVDVIETSQPRVPIPSPSVDTARPLSSNSPSPLPSFAIRNMVHVFHEHQFSTTSSQGTRASGGGLDGRSVSQWIGPSLRVRCDDAALKRTPILQQHLQKLLWPGSHSQSSGPSNTTVFDSVTVLPGNITIAWKQGYDASNELLLALQIGYLDDEPNQEEQLQQQQRRRRRVIEYGWKQTENLTDFNVRAWIERYESE